MAALNNALILVSWREKSRRQCNTKMRSASIDYLSVRKMGPNTTKALNNNVFFSLLFLSGSKRFLKTTKKKSTFLSIRESLRREKFYFGRFAKVYAREMQNFREFFVSRKFLLAKVSAPKVVASLKRDRSIQDPIYVKFCSEWESSIIKRAFKIADIYCILPRKLTVFSFPLSQQAKGKMTRIRPES